MGSHISGAGELQHRSFRQVGGSERAAARASKQSRTGVPAGAAARGKPRVRIGGAHLLLALKIDAVIFGDGGGDEDTAQPPAPG